MKICFSGKIQKKKKCVLWWHEVCNYKQMDVKMALSSSIPFQSQTRSPYLLRCSDMDLVKTQFAVFLSGK